MIVSQIKLGTRVKVTGPPSDNTVYGKVTKYKRNDNWEVIEYKIVFEDRKYGISDWFPVSQVKEA